MGAARLRPVRHQPHVALKSISGVHGQPRTNSFHHPEKLLRDDDEVP
jgi:hypothetical protein